MPLIDFVKAGLLSVGSQIAILAGVFFISGQLVPAWLSGFYATTTPVARTVVASILLFPLGNFLIARAFKLFNPAFVTPLNLAIVVLANVVVTVLILGARPSWHIIPATLVVMAGCVWLSLLLQQKMG